MLCNHGSIISKASVLVCLYLLSMHLSQWIIVIASGVLCNHDSIISKASVLCQMSLLYKVITALVGIREG